MMVGVAHDIANNIVVDCFLRKAKPAGAKHYHRLEEAFHFSSTESAHRAQEAEAVLHVVERAHRQIVRKVCVAHVIQDQPELF